MAACGSYTTLTKGNRLTLRRTTHAPPAAQPVWSEGAVWLVQKILRDGDGWCYKTGTSSRLRDAWCIAWNSRYVVGVWLGNPDGTSSGCLKGAKVALPLARSVTTLLSSEAELLSPPSVQRFLLVRLLGRLRGPLARRSYRLGPFRSIALCLLAIIISSCGGTHALAIAAGVYPILGRGRFCAASSSFGCRPFICIWRGRGLTFPPIIRIALL